MKALRTALLHLFLVITAALVPSFAQSRFTLTQTYCTGSTPCVLTYHNDGNRDGVNPYESTLRARTLSSANPAARWTTTTAGQIYGQPLYIHQLQVSGTYYDVVYVATEDNAVLALNAANGLSLASVNLNNSSDLSAGSTETAIPVFSLPGNTYGPPKNVTCGHIAPEVGITGTPVIDVSVTPPVVYLVTAHEDIDSHGNKTYRQKLHGLYADTLLEIPKSPLVLDSAFAAANAPGFNPLYNLQRAGLALISIVHGQTNDVANIWVSWASQCDERPYFGFEIAFEYTYPSTLTTPGFNNSYEVLNTEASCQTSPGPCQGGVWMGGPHPPSTEAAMFT